MNHNIITILGPTATGKTSVATTLAYKIQGEIISADSRQVYRGMDIGTGKDIVDYTIDNRLIPYHLIDIVDAGYKYNLFEYKTDFERVYNDISDKGNMPILCGGTGLYIESVLKNYNLMEVPVNQGLRTRYEGTTLAELTDVLMSIPHHTMHNKTDVDTVKRAIRAIEIATYNAEHHIEEQKESKLKPIIFGIDISRELRRERISKRLKTRFEEGMIDEVKGLIDSGVVPEDLIYYGLEYKFITRYIIGELNYQEMYEGLEIAIHQFAKRQMTWFRGMEKRDFAINWIDGTQNVENRVAQIMAILAEK